MIISDGASVFAGGMNVGGQYMTLLVSPDAWTDVSFTVLGPAIHTFATVFEADWANANIRGAPLPAHSMAQAATGTARAQLVPSGPGIDEDALHDALVHAIHCAHTGLAGIALLPAK
jgi:cardiolipin synthase